MTMTETRYKDLTIDQLHGMFRQESYFTLSEDQKQNLYQEVINRQCAQDGIDEVPFRFEDLDPSIAGYYNGNEIVLNRGLFADGQIASSIELPDGTVQDDIQAIEDANWLGLQSAIHEYAHVRQANIVNGSIVTTEEERILFTANQSGTSSVIQTDEGLKVGSQYMTGAGDQGLILYDMNPVELDAEQRSEAYVEQVLKDLKLTEDDQSVKMYRERIAYSGVQQKLEQARQQLGSETIDKDIAEILISDYYHIENDQIDPKLRSIVENEMIAAYQSANELDELEPFDLANQEPAEEESLQTIDLSAFDNAQQLDDKIEIDIGSSIHFTSVSNDNDLDMAEENGCDMGNDDIGFGME